MEEKLKEEDFEQLRELILKYVTVSQKYSYIAGFKKSSAIWLESMQ